MVEATSMVSPAICGDNLKSSSPREFARLIERGVRDVVSCQWQPLH